MSLRRPWVFGLCLASATLAATGAANAEPLRVHLEGGAAKAIMGAQERETGWGWTGGGALELGLTPALGVQLELANVSLAAGDPPADRTLAPRGASSAQSVMLG